MDYTKKDKSLLVAVRMQTFKRCDNKVHPRNESEMFFPLTHCVWMYQRQKPNANTEFSFGFRVIVELIELKASGGGGFIFQTLKIKQVNTVYYPTPTRLV